jgi:hypothetical protein
MKDFHSRDYVKKVHEILKRDHPELKIETVARVIAIYNKNLRKLFTFKRTIHLGGWVKIRPFSRKYFKEQKIKNEINYD